MSSYTLSKEQKEDIIRKIRHEGKKAHVVAEEYGIKPKVIYGSLSGHARSTSVTPSETKLRKENKTLKELLATLTLELTKEKKKRGN